MTRHLSEEAKQKISESRKGKGKGRVLSEETKRKISENRKGKGTGRVLSEEEKQKLQEARKKSPYGHPHTEESRRKISEAHKGKKGQVHTEESKRKISESLKGKKFSEETIEKRRQSRMGYQHSEETRKKISEASLGQKNSEEHNQKIRESIYRIKDTPEYRSKISEGVKNAYANNEEFRERQLELGRDPEKMIKLQEARSKRVYTSEQRERLSGVMLDRWKNDDGTMLAKARKSQLIAAKASQEANPSSLEIQVKGLLDVLDIDYEQQKPIGIYTADFFLPAHNLILEIYGCYWHSCPLCGYEYPGKNGYDKRREHYIRACGYNFFVLWEHDLTNLDLDSLLNKE